MSEHDVLKLLCVGGPFAGRTAVLRGGSYDITIIARIVGRQAPIDRIEHMEPCQEIKSERYFLHRVMLRWGQVASLSAYVLRHESMKEEEADTAGLMALLTSAMLSCCTRQQNARDQVAWWPGGILSLKDYGP